MELFGFSHRFYQMIKHHHNKVKDNGMSQEKGNNSFDNHDANERAGDDASWQHWYQCHQ